MQELMKCLDRGTPGNALARLFHIDVKGLIVKALTLIASMPELDPKEFQYQNTHQFYGLLNWLLEHEQVPRQRKHYKIIATFLIRLYDSDEAYRRPMYQVAKKLQELPLVDEELPRPELWQP